MGMPALNCVNVVKACSLVALSVSLVLPTVKGSAATGGGRPIVAPLPISVAVGTRRLDEGAPVTFSPDGELLAFTLGEQTKTAETSESVLYTDSGVPRSGSVPHAQIVRVSGGSIINLTGDGVSSWSGAWSPDGRRFAYYSNQGGVAGLWIWDRRTERSVKVPGVVARPFDSNEDRPRWIDARHVVLKTIPSSMSIREANALVPSLSASAPQPPRRQLFLSPIPANASTVDQPTSAMKWTRTWLSDLVIADTESGQKITIASNVKVTGYRVSPDRKTLVYSELLGSGSNSAIPILRLVAIDLDGRYRSRIVAPETHRPFGTFPFGWAGDSRHIAYTSLDPGAGSSLVVSDLRGKSLKVRLTAEGLSAGTRAPAYYRDVAEPKDAPSWSADGRNVYVVSGTMLLRYGLDTPDKPLNAVAAVGIQRLVTIGDSDVAWTSSQGELAAVTRGGDGQADAICIIKRDGKVSITSRPSRPSSISASAVGLGPHGSLAFAAQDQDHLPDIWLTQLGKVGACQLTYLNSELDHYALGETQVIRWKSPSGADLSGLLTLPSNWRAGDPPPPLLVWVYGGTTALDRRYRYGFGWAEGNPQYDLHVLTTRGYAVFFPSIPDLTSQHADNFCDAILSGVDEVIRQKLADPTKLAIAGQSYGSYTAWSILGRTGRFKAAITTGNVVHPDLIALYLRADAPADAPLVPALVEKGQLHLEGSPWAFPNRYHDESPVFFLEKWQTPLLMGEGDEDGQFGTWAANSLFVALTRLGKPVEYVIYRNEGHSIMSQDNITDFWERRVRFLNDKLGLGS